MKHAGLDKKGSRLYAGICAAERHNLSNVAFVRGDLELLTAYFGPGELDEVWITFPEPQASRRQLISRESLISRFLFAARR